MSAMMLWVTSVLLLMGLLFHIMPVLTRRDLFFAVTVRPEFCSSPEGRAILRRYRTILWASILAALAAVQVIHMPVAAVLVPGAGFVWAFLSARRRALAHAVAPNAVLEVDLNAPEERLPGGWIGMLIPIVLLIGLGVWAAFHMDRLPARIATHWGFGGADAWVATTPAALSGLLGAWLMVCLLLAAMVWGLINGSRRIATSGRAAAGERQFRRRVVILMLAIEYLMVFPPAFTLLAPEAPGITAWAVSLTVVILLSAVGLFRAGQGGARTVPAAAGVPVGDRTPDDCWKWGMFYFNPADPSILVEKRFGIGYTLNFAHRGSWVALAVILLPMALFAIFLK